MPLDRGGESSESGETVPKTPEQMIKETRAERDAYRLSVPFEQIDPQNIPDRHKYHGEMEPLTPEEQARLEADEGDEWDGPEGVGTGWRTRQALAEREAAQQETGGTTVQQEVAPREAVEPGVAGPDAAGRETTQPEADGGEHGEAVEGVEHRAGPVADGQRLTVTFEGPPAGAAEVDEGVSADQDLEAGAEADGEAGDSAEQRDPERLHAFGNKDAPRPVRLVKDLPVESWNAVIGPYQPRSPNDTVHGASTYIDPERPDVPVKGKYHRLPSDWAPPEGSGLGIHADGKDVPGIDDKKAHPWGHRTIYPTEPMTAAEFAQRVADLPWEYAGNKKEKKEP